MISRAKICLLAGTHRSAVIHWRSLLFFAVTVLALVTAAHATPVSCPAVAVAHGDETTATELLNLLAQRGIAATAPVGCGALDVQIQPQGRRLRLSMKDPYGRIAVRT